MCLAHLNSPPFGHAIAIGVTIIRIRPVRSVLVSPRMVLIDGIEIHGSPRFEYRTRQALEVLSGSPTFVSVKGYLTAIREARSSGLAATWGTTTFRVGPRTWQAPLVWYASAIVHDTGHAQLYRENRQRFLGFWYTPSRAWTGVEAERLCLRLQLAALRDLGASQEVLRYVESLVEHPTYQDKWIRTW